MGNFRRSILAENNAAREQGRQNASGQDRFSPPDPNVYGPPETISDMLCTNANIAITAGDMFVTRLKRSAFANYTVVGAYSGLGLPVAAATGGFAIYEIRSDAGGFIRLHLVKSVPWTSAAGGPFSGVPSRMFDQYLPVLDRRREYAFATLVLTGTTYNASTYRDADAALVATGGASAMYVPLMTAFPDTINTITSDPELNNPRLRPHPLGRVLYTVLYTTGSFAFIY